MCIWVGISVFVSVCITVFLCKYISMFVCLLKNMAHFWFVCVYLLTWRNDHTHTHSYTVTSILSSQARRTVLSKERVIDHSGKLQKPREYILRHSSSASFIYLFTVYRATVTNIISDISLKTLVDEGGSGLKLFQLDFNSTKAVSI